MVCWVYVLCEKFARFTFYEGRGIPGSLANQNAAKCFTLVHSQSQIRNVGWSWFIPQRSSYDCSRYPCCFYVVRPYCVWLLFCVKYHPRKIWIFVNETKGKKSIISWYQLGTGKEAVIYSGLRHCGKHIWHISVLTFYIRQVAS